MVIQDQRVTEQAKTAIPSFFKAVKELNSELVQKYLQKQSSLIYARDEDGSTAIHFMIGVGSQESLNLFRLMIAIVREKGREPDFDLRDEDGWNAKTLLQLHAGTHIVRDFATAMGIDLPPLEEADVYSSRERAALETREAAHREETKDLNEKIDRLTAGKKKGSSCIVSMVHEKTYGDHLQELFSKQHNFYGYRNLDEEKRINQETAEMSNLLDGISFSPKSFALTSLESEASIIIIPQNLADILGRAYEYFFGNHQA